MNISSRSLAALGAAAVVGFAAGHLGGNDRAAAQSNAFTALDYQEITQLINRYAYGIDTCANNGYDYANVFTTDGVFIDRNSDAGFAAGGRVLALLDGDQAAIEQRGPFGGRAGEDFVQRQGGIGQRAGLVEGDAESEREQREEHRRGGNAAVRALRQTRWC